ncbi:elongation factor P 5-aminopentanone reductase [Alkalicoccus saliphilus]|jgi:3-oxoacyl-[acyl-carrier protein] reductase|uniref:Short chain dehydrogenase n=1 Tax=Alkalicoccus saliphilus TaxID=200989 RepID=A0A2T4U895_9BACI|nr:SDR family oxidoreductase [Alkalicoccus saliphilus]PTL39606.1 short chain dehydrogenase [Alkalicoccus saliphilus]
MKPWALITGATGSIGQAAAEALAEKYNLILHYCHNKEKAEKLKEELVPVTKVTLFQADFNNPGLTVETLAELPDTPALLLHSAGVSRPMLFQEEAFGKMSEEMNIAVITPAAIIRSLLPHMIQRQSGNIIFVSSIWGETGASMEVTYSTCKAAQNGLVKSLAKETAPSGIRVNAVAPGAVESDMMKMYSPEEQREITSEIPLSRFAKPEEIASCITFLSEKDSSYISGHVLQVNGGWYT